MMMDANSERLLCDLDSHTSNTTQSTTPSHHLSPQHVLQNLNSQLSHSSIAAHQDPLTLGLLLPFDALQEHAVKDFFPQPAAFASPAKRRVTPPPALKVAIPHDVHTRNKWHIVPQSPGLTDSGAVTLLHSEQSGIGAGYFSPPRSPDASQSVSLPASQSPFAASSTETKRTRSRSRSVVSLGKQRGNQKMVKERRSLQSLLIPSFFQSSLQPQTTPLGLGLVPGPRSPALPMSSTPATFITSSSSGAEGNRNEYPRSEKRRSFYGRKRSNTFAGGNSGTATATTSDFNTLPPMPDELTASVTPGAGGRESPSAYLLDEDPFAFTPAPVSTQVSSPVHSQNCSPLHSPPHSLVHSRASSTVSLSSASSASMPGTPVFQQFGMLPENRREGTSPISSSSFAAMTVPVPPPPTPVSPLNPNIASCSGVTESLIPKERTPRSHSASAASSNPVPALAQPKTPAPSPLSPSRTSSSVQSLPHPPPTRVRPAHTRPAFAPRPSLPSLTTLSRMTAVAGGLANPFRGMKRRGTVGAGLPTEPWDIVEADVDAEADAEGNSMDIQETEGEVSHDEILSEKGLNESLNDNEDIKSEVTEKDEQRAIDGSLEESFDSVVGDDVQLSRETDSNAVSDIASSPTASPSSVMLELVEGAHLPSMLAPANVRSSENDFDRSVVQCINPEAPELKNEETVLERDDEDEDDNQNRADDAVGADGEVEASIDIEDAYSQSILSRAVDNTDGGNVIPTNALTTDPEVTSFSEMNKEQSFGTDAEPEADILNGGRSSAELNRTEDEAMGGEPGEDLGRLAAAAADPSSSFANGPVRVITIPGRASAIPSHVLRALTPSPFASPNSASGFSSPASSNASLSPQSSIEDFGILLSASPRFRGDQRPESLTIDPALPSAPTRTSGYARTRPLSSEKDDLYLESTPLPSSSSSAPFLPSLISCEGGDSGIETEADCATDSDLGSASDIAGAELQSGPAAHSYATPLDYTSRSRGTSVSSPIVVPSEQDNPQQHLSSTPIRTDDIQEFTSSSEEFSSSLSHAEDYADYYLEAYEDGGEYIQELEHPEEDEDSSMLPPLSTLPEDDPVFSLTPAHSRERYGVGVGEYPSRPMSRKSSAATIASIFSMKSGSSGRASQNSHTYSRTHSSAASLSNSLPYSNSQSRSRSGSSLFMGKDAPKSPSFGSTDSGRGHVPSSSVSSLHSQSSLDLRGLASVRRQDSQSSEMSMLTHSSTRTKFDPHVQVHAQKEPSVEEISLGLRSYTGNPYAVAVQAELEGKVTKYDIPRKARYDDEELVDIGKEDEDGVTGESESDTLHSGWKPFFSKAGGADAFEPGSSAGTLRPFATQTHKGSRSELGTNAVFGGSNDSVSPSDAHGYGYSGSRSGAGRGWGDTGGYGNRYNNGSSGSDYSGDHRGGLGSGRGGRDNSRDDERQRRKPSLSSPSTSASESESESESETDNYGEQSSGTEQRTTSAVPSAPAPVPRLASVHSQEEPVSPIFNQLRNGRKGVFRPPTISTADNGNGGRPATAEDDDVPLAQRIPGAINAQKSIRQQVRSERDRRRRERSVAPTPRTSRAPEGTISPPPQHVPGDERGRSLLARLPKTAPLGAGAGALSSSQEAAMMAQRMMQPQHASHAGRRQRAKTFSEAGGAGVPAEDLAKRLLKVQAREPDASMPAHRTLAASPTHPLPGNQVHSAGDRLHIPSRRSPHSPQDRSQPPHSAVDAPAPARTLRTMRSFHGLTPAATSSNAGPTPPLPSSLARRPTSATRSSRHPADVTSGSEELPRHRSMKNSIDKNVRISTEEAQLLLSHHPNAHVHSMPPFSGVSRGQSPPPSARLAIMQTRIYIGSMQRFNVVEAGLETSARDVLDMLRQQGDLRSEERRLNSWMLYEVCHDFGMERPVRSFELVADISGSWNKEKTMNCFMVKQTHFAQSLATIPSSIPTRSGFVDYETKKGKWNKRWLELREHGLWLSKREGRDDEFLCSLSAFDAYIVTRIHKSTKAFTFAVKSTDPITLFENKADYLHVFSVPEDTGSAWVEAIWLARSYIMYQEKNVLFRNKNAGEGAASGVSAAASVARSAPRKKPAQTYVTIAPPDVAQVTGPFEPGSLLAKRAVAS